MSEQHVSFADRVKGQLGADGAGAPEAAQQAEAPTLGSVIRKAQQTMNHDVYAEMYGKVMLPSMKAIGSTDILDLRVVDLTGPTEKINKDTVFRNWLTAKPTTPITDYQVRIIEVDSTGSASPVNLDNTSLPPVTQSTYSSRYNTATAFALTVKGGWMAKAHARLQGREDPANRSIQAAYTKIRRGENAVLLSNTEQVSEVLPNVPQMHGFLTASTANGLTSAGADLVVAELDSTISTITGIYGKDVQLMMLTDFAQTAVIDAMMIARFPGNNPMAYMERMDLALREVLAANGLVPNTVYISRQASRPIPVFYEPQLATGANILFIADKPSLARFEFVEGQTDIVALARVEPTFYDVTALVDVITLLDPLVDSRIKITTTN